MKKRTQKQKPCAGIVTDFTLTNYGTMVAAEADAQEFKRDDVFYRRSALFPSPVNYGVTVVVESATPVKLPKPTNPLNPCGLKVIARVTGARAQEWIKAMQGRVQVLTR